MTYEHTLNRSTFSLLLLVFTDLSVGWIGTRRYISLSFWLLLPFFCVVVVIAPSNHIVCASLSKATREAFESVTRSVYAIDDSFSIN